jgi:sec-independent protein translocase protein TatB
MFDIGPTELLLIVVVAVLVIGPKDLPLALRTAGKWIGKMRKVSGQFRSGFEAMVREAEMQELEAKWKAQNEKIMREHPEGGPPGTEQTGAYPAAPVTPIAQEPPPPASAEAKAITVDNPDEYRDMPSTGEKPNTPEKPENAGTPEKPGS